MQACFYLQVRGVEIRVAQQQSSLLIMLIIRESHATGVE